MTYTPEHQYRCTIIRGKSQSEMEDLLPFYVQTVHKFCPCTKSEFDNRCNRQLSKYFFSNEDYEGLPHSNQKTIRNHITEILGKLLGLYYTTADGMVYETEACSYLLQSNDFPAFFKNICINFQFPNYADSTNTIKERMSNRIGIRPMCYVVSFLDYARKQTENKAITKQEIGFYILNNLDVLQGKVSVADVYSKIMADRKAKCIREKLIGSYEWQHIKEQFNMLELANVAETDKDYIWLNNNESKAIEFFCKMNKEPIFDFYKYDIDNDAERKQAQTDWCIYFGKLNKEIKNLNTVFEEPVIQKTTKERGAVGVTTVELGDKGEAYVYKMECERVRAYKERLVNKVLLLGKTKGLGYDISSIEADENPNKPEFARYIEVKTTTRISEPSFDNYWSDTINLTSKEWIAAEQYGPYYNIYRVYFTKTKTIVVKINNPYQKALNKEIDVFPTIYQMDFTAQTIKKQFETGK